MVAREVALFAGEAGLLRSSQASWMPAACAAWPPPAAATAALSLPCDPALPPPPSIARPPLASLPHKQGNGAVLLRDGGLPGDVFVGEYLGELYAAWRWLERDPRTRKAPAWHAAAWPAAMPGWQRRVAYRCRLVGMAGTVVFAGAALEPQRLQLMPTVHLITLPAGARTGVTGRRGFLRLGTSDEFYNVAMERPPADERGYDVLFVNVRSVV